MRSPCPRGSRCVGGQAEHELCPTNQYNDLERQWACKECPEDRFCSQGAVEPSAAAPCKKGEYYVPGCTNCTDGLTNSSCILCPIGHQCDGNKKEPCPDGHLSITVGAVFCTPCPSGR